MRKSQSTRREFGGLSSMGLTTIGLLLMNGFYGLTAAYEVTGLPSDLTLYVFCAGGLLLFYICWKVLRNF